MVNAGLWLSRGVRVVATCGRLCLTNRCRSVRAVAVMTIELLRTVRLTVGMRQVRDPLAFALVRISRR